MKILITGSNGFIGKNLRLELENRGYHELLLCSRSTTPAELDGYAQECDFVFHLAGVNRPQNEEDFMKGNFGFTSELLKLLESHGNKCPVLLTSSTQALLDNPYGASKKAGEELLLKYGGAHGTKVLIYRLSNVFGKWCRPNYNSVMATFCHNIAADLPITISDREHAVTLTYIDDVVDNFISAMEGKVSCAKDGLYYVLTAYPAKLGDIADLLHSFRETRKSLKTPYLAEAFAKKLYSTYLSYLPKDQFAYPLKMNVDERGSFTEFLKSEEWGQVSVNISKPGITKGNHWHHTKNEKFLVVSGTGTIRFRHPLGGEVLEYLVNGKELQVVDIPPGYSHSITNLGEGDMVTIMWANELFNPEKPDTYYLEV